MSIQKSYNWGQRLHLLKVKYTNLHGGTYSLRKVSITHTFPIIFQMFFFNFWAIFGAPGALAVYFRILLIPLRIPYFFRRFDLFSQSQIYQSPRRHILTTYLQHTSHTLFKKNSKFVGALSRGPWGYCQPFSNSPSPATNLQIFSDVSTSFLTSFFTTLNLLMIGSQYVYKQGWPTYGPSPIHGPYSFHLTPTPGGKRWIPTSIVTPTPVIYSFLTSVQISCLPEGTIILLLCVIKHDAEKGCIGSSGVVPHHINFTSLSLCRGWKSHYPLNRRLSEPSVSLCDTYECTEASFHFDSVSSHMWF